MCVDVLNQCSNGLSGLIFFVLFTYYCFKVAYRLGQVKLFSSFVCANRTVVLWLSSQQSLHKLLLQLKRNIPLIYASDWVEDNLREALWAFRKEGRDHIKGDFLSEFAVTTEQIVRVKGGKMVKSGIVWLWKYHKEDSIKQKAFILACVHMCIYWLTGIPRKTGG